MLYDQEHLNAIQEHGWQLDTRKCLVYADTLYDYVMGATRSMLLAAKRGDHESAIAYEGRLYAFSEALSAFAGEKAKYYRDKARAEILKEIWGNNV